MAKKKYYNNDTKETTEEEVVEEQAVETEAPVEEVKEEAPVEEPVKEEPKEEVKEEEAPVEDTVDVSKLPDNYGDDEDATPVADVTNGEPEATEGEADPLPELEGSYYLKVYTGFHKSLLVETRLEHRGIKYIVTATGDILVGSYKTVEEANAATTEMLRKGFKTEVVKMA